MEQMEKTKPKANVKWPRLHSLFGTLVARLTRVNLPPWRTWPSWWNFPTNTVTGLVRDGCSPLGSGTPSPQRKLSQTTSPSTLAAANTSLLALGRPLPGAPWHLDNLIQHRCPFWRHTSLQRGHTGCMAQLVLEHGTGVTCEHVLELNLCTPLWSH